MLITTNISAANYKIGVLDINMILANTPQVEAMQTKLKNQFEPKIKELALMNKTLHADVEMLKKEHATLADAKQKKLQIDIVRQQKKIRQFKANFEHNFSQAQELAQQTILKQIQAAVSKIAKKQNYDLILIKDTVPYNLAEFDISNLVIAQLKKVG